MKDKTQASCCRIGRILKAQKMDGSLLTNSKDYNTYRNNGGMLRSKNEYETAKRVTKFE